MLCSVDCLFWLIIYLFCPDKEAPKTSDCPSPIYETSTSTSKTVSWSAPTFTDNVGVTKVESTRNPGDSFSIGSTNVHYTATDAAHNVGSCKFMVTVKSKCVNKVKGLSLSFTPSRKLTLPSPPPPHPFWIAKINQHFPLLKISSPQVEPLKCLVFYVTAITKRARSSLESKL